MFRNIVGVLLFTFCLLSCKAKQADVSLNITVNSSQNEPIMGAQINIDGEKLGLTDNLGKFNKILPVEMGEKRRVEVTKQSDDYYFAPYYDVFLVNEKDQQTVNINAIMYFVPKPSPDDRANLAAIENKENPTSQAQSTQQEISMQPLDVTVAQGTNSKTSKDNEDPLITKIENEGSVPQTTAITTNNPEQQEPVPQPKQSQILLNAISATEQNDSKTPQKPSGAILYTIHAYAGSQPVAGAVVFMGDNTIGNLETACTTNNRGRCIIKLPEVPPNPQTIVVKKDGFITTSQNTRITHKGNLRFNLIAGNAIDIFTMSQAYNFSRGISGVSVMIQGKQVGQTDKFGRLTYVYDGAKSDLIDITLESRQFLPETFETDFVVSGPMSLVKFFAPKDPPAMKISLFRAKPAGSFNDKQMEYFINSFDLTLKRQLNTLVHPSIVFEEFSLGTFERLSNSLGKTTEYFLQNGWEETKLKGLIDGILLPTVVIEDTPILELSIIASTGKVLAAAKEPFASLEDEESLHAAVQSIYSQLLSVLPFEGAVTEASKGLVKINIGSESGRSIKIGEIWEAYGNQIDKAGKKQEQKKIATLSIKEVKSRESLCAVSNLEPRSTIHRGDLVRRNQNKDSPSDAYIKVTQLIKNDTQPIAQANIYFNEQWIGATDATGTFKLNHIRAGGLGSLKVIKHGFKDFTKEVSLSKRKKIELNLVKEMSFIRIETKPNNAKIKIEDRLLGPSPLMVPVPIPSGFVKLEILAPNGYKNYKTVLELDQGTLDLTGTNAIELEKDYLSPITNLLNSGKIKLAVQRLKEVPEHHSDYLQAQHELGELYLSMLSQPARAAQAFHKVTSHESVKSFQDKRFIGSHINEGIALYLTAEKIQQENPEMTKAHLTAALEIFNNALPHIRFVAQDQYVAAQNNVNYYKALCEQKLWDNTKDPIYLANANKSWQLYLDERTKGDVPADQEITGFVDNARVYLKQTEMLLKTIGQK